ncbi:MAG: hypothetical protein JWO03_2282 [Bacteroidetes bacterium]|nr:hypothetical protein [Bacteroidota bacterium]
MKKYNILIVLIFMVTVTVTISACCKCEKNIAGCKGEEKSSAANARKFDTVTTVANLRMDTFYLKIGAKHYKMMKVHRDSVAWDEHDGTMASAMAAARTSTGSKAEKCTSDYFAGTDRMDAKTSIFRGNVTRYNTINDLIADLPSDADMKAHDPKITKLPTSERVAEEQKYVKVSTAYIYGIYRENDNDFHCIVGNGEVGGTRMKLFNIEFSALPPKNSHDYADMNDVRSQIIEKFGDLACGDGAFKPVEELIPVSIEGPLFFDIDHPAGVVGFSAGGITFHPKTAWEIHPVVKLDFQ